jgi:predicted DCC family thiol-disulfide oxidoreductase YuxK
MASSVKSGEKILVYDGDCPMCTATIARLLGAGLIKSEQVISNHDLAGADLEAALAAGIRNQLVVLDPETRETRAGSDGLLWIIGHNTNHRALVRVLSLPGLRHLLRWGYETISYNRRIVSPPRHQVRCDCEPEVTLARRLMLIVPLLSAALLLAGLFGASVFVGGALGQASSGALLMMAAEGVLVMALVIAACITLRGEQRVDYVAHLSVIVFIGSLVLIPATSIAPFCPPAVAITLGGLALLAGLILTLKMQFRRVAGLGLSARWLWAWFAAWGFAAAVAAGVYL